MSKQSRKHTIGLAGEFLVAGELLRRGIMAAVTYGNAKKADVIAINGATAVSLEVKSTSQSKWVLGGELPADNSNIWVLVHLPENEIESPEYFVLISAELRKLLLSQHEAYNIKYRENMVRISLQEVLLQFSANSSQATAWELGREYMRRWV